jgi:phage gpG-like protein
MPDFRNLGKDLANQARLVQKLATGDLQRIIGVEGLNHFQASWQKQGWEDQGVRKWESRKEPLKKFKKKGGQLASYKKWRAKNAKRAILISHRTDTAGGHLKDSISYRIAGTRVIFYTDKPYARVHNEGGKAGRGSGFVMKQRQFMGKSYRLDMNIKAKLDREMDKIFK